MAVKSCRDRGRRDCAYKTQRVWKQESDREFKSGPKLNKIAKFRNIDKSIRCRD